VRILLTSPFAHPYVRRGVERYVGELADWLAGQGHEVVLLTTAPDRSRSESRPSGALTVFVRSGASVGRGRLRVDELIRTTAPILRGLLRLGSFDRVEAHHYPDATALRSTALPRRGGYDFWLPGVPRRTSFLGRPLHRAEFGWAVGGARRLLALSEHAAAALHAEFGHQAVVLPPGVDTSRYDGPRPSDPDQQLIFCPAAPDDPRKRVEVLVRALPLVKKRRPHATLLLAPPTEASVVGLLASLDDDLRAYIKVRVPDSSEELAALYRRAQVTVLPSLDEAFGLVLVESLAAGTPVVGTNSGGIPEIISDPAIGRLAAADDPEDLADAITACLDLGSDTDLSERCRRFARRWDWDQVGPRWLELDQP